MKTFDVEVKKTIQFTEEDLNDILCSCFEGGCGYWCCVDNTTVGWDEAREKLHLKGNTDPTMEDIMLQMLVDGKPIRLIDQEEDKVYSLYMMRFTKGIKMSIENGFWNGNDIWDVDGLVGDAIIQYAVFGEQVYG